MIYNGQIYYHEKTDQEAIVQWLYEDTWVLLSAPFKAREPKSIRRNAMMPISNFSGDGIMFYSKRQLEDRLKSEGWHDTLLTIYMDVIK